MTSIGYRQQSAGIEAAVPLPTEERLRPVDVCWTSVL